MHRRAGRRRFADHVGAVAGHQHRVGQRQHRGIGVVAGAVPQEAVAEVFAHGGGQLRRRAARRRRHDREALRADGAQGLAHAGEIASREMLRAAGAAERHRAARRCQRREPRIGRGARRRKLGGGEWVRRGQRRDDVGAAQRVMLGNPDQVHLAARPARVLQEHREHVRPRPLPGAHIGHGDAAAGDDEVGRGAGEGCGVARVDRPPGREPAVEVARRDAAHLVVRAERLDDAERVDLVTDAAGAEDERAQARDQIPAWRGSHCAKARASMSWRLRAA